MQKINVQGVGLLNEEQIRNLVYNARILKAENKVLREEISHIKEASL